MRKYLFELEIEEGNDPFWEGVRDNNITGCEELYKVLEDLLYESGFIINGPYKNSSLSLIRYYNK